MLTPRMMCNCGLATVESAPMCLSPSLLVKLGGDGGPGLGAYLRRLDSSRPSTGNVQFSNEVGSCSMLTVSVMLDRETPGSKRSDIYTCQYENTTDQQT
jgi:hypothetical protein